MKSNEKSGSYPPRFKLVFHPHTESKYDRRQLINITLRSSKGTLPIAVELNGKFRGESISFTFKHDHSTLFLIEPYEGACGLERCNISGK